MHCVYVSRLLGPVSTPFLSMLLVVGTLWWWLKTCALCARIPFTWTGVHSTSLNAVGCRYTMVVAEDVHCVHVSCLLGPVSTPFLSMLLVVGTPW